jgi:hypothetical protein
MLLSACGAASSAQKTSKNQRQLESSACKMIGFTSIPGASTGSFEVISMPLSTLIALERTDDRALEAVVRRYDTAASAQNTDAMIRALNIGVEVCHDLGLRTAT